MKKQSRTTEALSAQIEQVAPYAALSRVYDRVMAHVNYKRWAFYLEAIFRRQAIREGKILDIGCGTGKLVAELHRRGWLVAGCDPSPEMIAVARKTYPRLHFMEDGLPELTGIEPHQFQIMLCLYDTINYLPSLNEVEQALVRIYRLLPLPGLFVFDVVTPLHCQTYFSNYTEREALGPDIYFERTAYFQRALRVQHNQIRLITPQGVFEENHRQQIYEIPELVGLIRRLALFESCTVFDDFSFKPADGTSGRVHFVLKKA